MRRFGPRAGGPSALRRRPARSDDPDMSTSSPDRSREEEPGGRDLPWVQHQLDSLAMSRTAGGLRPDEDAEYRRLCALEVELLAGRPSRTRGAA